MRTLAVASILMALLPSAALSQAKSSPVVVSYADLDLRNSAGLSVLDRRLDRAVRKVCDADEGTTDLRSRVSAGDCVEARLAQLAADRSRAISKRTTRPAFAREP
jgi:UrcA family protein